MPRKSKLPYQGTYHWRAILDFLELRLVAGVESIDGDCYRRFGEDWHVTVSHAPGELIAQIHGSAPQDTVARLRHLFDIETNIRQVEEHLRQFPALQVAQHPGLRLPGCWDAFELVIRAILGQQVSVKGAATLSARLVDRFGAPTPDALADVDVSVIGLPQPRAACIRAVAQAVLDGVVDLHDATSLEAVKGIGPWTAQYVMMRAKRDADAFPASDLVLMKASGHASPRALAAAAEAWRPYRAYAAMHIWRSS